MILREMGKEAMLVEIIFRLSSMIHTDLGIALGGSRPRRETVDVCDCQETSRPRIPRNRRRHGTRNGRFSFACRDVMGRGRFKGSGPDVVSTDSSLSQPWLPNK